MLRPLEPRVAVQKMQDLLRYCSAAVDAVVAKRVLHARGRPGNLKGEATRASGERHTCGPVEEEADGSGRGDIDDEDDRLPDGFGAE